MASSDARPVTRPDAPSRTSRLWLRVLLSCVFGIALVAALWPAMAGIPADPWIGVGPIAVYLALLVPFHLLRAGRWWALLRTQTAIGPREAIAIGLVGYMWIAILPLRLGELVRPWLVLQRHATPFGRTLAVVALERVSDGILVVAMFGAAATIVPEDPIGVAVALGARITAGVFGVALVGLVVLARWPGLWTAASGMLRRIGGARLVAIGDPLVLQLAAGLRAAADRRAQLGFAAMTLAYWSCNVLGAWWLANACGLAIDLRGAVVVTAVMNLAMTVPGGPAQLGVFQGGVAAGIVLVAGTDALTGGGDVFAFWLYACQLGSIAIAGLVAGRVLGVRWDSGLFRGAPPRVGEDRPTEARMGAMNPDDASVR
jgi:hypothetical protein